MELTQGQFHIEQRQAAKDEKDAVGHQEGTTAILVADVGKAPDIAQIDGKADDGQQELGLLAPSLALSLRHGNDQNALQEEGEKLKVSAKWGWVAMPGCSCSCS